MHVHNKYAYAARSCSSFLLFAAAQPNEATTHANYLPVLSVLSLNTI